MAELAGSVRGRAFRPLARIMRTLGRELISSEHVALIELIKNAYDAEASMVLVRFGDADGEAGGSLDVIDDGHGMTAEVVSGAWLEPATDFKKKSRLSRSGRRRLLGEKGVGRFASSRLADELELVTRPAGSASEIFAIFDWTQFDEEDRYLDEVLILTEERTASEISPGWALTSYRSGSDETLADGSQGTILRMRNLRRKWTKAHLDELTNAISRLVAPGHVDAGFRILLQRPGEATGHAQEVTPPEVLKYPHYTVNGTLREDGTYRIEVAVLVQGQTHVLEGVLFRRAKDSLLVDMTLEAFHESETEASRHDMKSLVCGALRFEIKAWDRDQLDNVHQMLGGGIRDIRRDLNSIAGIMIYRDGFRVLPYGEPNNDWLRLDLRRVQSPSYRLSNNQISGNIFITADGNPLLKDQSNREGLDSNLAYVDLCDVVMSALGKLEALRTASKKAAPAGNASDQPPGLFDPIETRQLEESLTAKLSAADPDVRKLVQTAELWNERMLRFKEALSQYRSLATVGTIVDKVIHEGRQPLSTMSAQASLAVEEIRRHIKPGLNPICVPLNDINEVAERLDKVGEAAHILDTVLRRIEPLGGRRRGRPAKLYIEKIIADSFDFFSAELKSENVQVALPTGEMLVTVDQAEIQEIFINLINNSLHWLRNVSAKQRHISVELRRPGSTELEIIFSDSGPGVPKNLRQSIFEPYFSTREGGTGLGLVICGEIIRNYYDGRFELLPNGPLPGATFRILLRKRV